MPAINASTRLRASADGDKRQQVEEELDRLEEEIDELIDKGVSPAPSQYKEREALRKKLDTLKGSKE